MLELISEQEKPGEQTKIQRAQELLRGDCWSLPPEIWLGEEVLAEIERRLLALGWTADEIGNFPMVVHEAFINGVVHGTFDEKIRPEEENLSDKTVFLSERVREKELSGRYKGKKVAVELNLTSEEATVAITDEGKGFFVEAVPDPTNPEKLLEPTGRGVDMMKKICDRVSFEGSTVSLYKKKSISKP